MNIVFLQRSVLKKHNSRKKANDVNEWSATGRPVVSGRDCHVPHVTLSQASARKMKLKAAIATWKVKTIPQKGKF